MSLKLKDLLAHEQSLTNIIKHADKERSAVRFLIEGIRLRTDSFRSDSGNGQNKAIGRPKTLVDFIKNQATKYGNSWFSPKMIADEIVHTGFRRKSQWNSLRPTVSTTLRKLYESGEVKRRNKGTDDKPVYEYSRMKDDELFTE